MSPRSVPKMSSLLRRGSIAVLCVTLVVGISMSASAGPQAGGISAKAAPVLPAISSASGSSAHTAVSSRVTKVAAKKKTKTLTSYVTAYTFYDNTPVGTAQISHPVLHKRAGGTGSYANPITMAVGHRYVRGRDVLDFAKGTRFYMPYLDRYFIVEDSCGDGRHPEKVPCHIHPKVTAAWVDIWIDGRGGGANRATRCAYAITGKHRIEINPPRNRKVKAGVVSRPGRCGR